MRNIVHDGRCVYDRGVENLDYQLLHRVEGMILRVVSAVFATFIPFGGEGGVEGGGRRGEGCCFTRHDRGVIFFFCQSIESVFEAVVSMVGAFFVFLSVEGQAG